MFRDHGDPCTQVLALLPVLVALWKGSCAAHSSFSGTLSLECASAACQSQLNNYDDLLKHVAGCDKFENGIYLCPRHHQLEHIGVPVYSKQHLKGKLSRCLRHISKLCSGRYRIVHIRPRAMANHQKTREVDTTGLCSSEKISSTTALSSEKTSPTMASVSELDSTELEEPRSPVSPDLRYPCKTASAFVPPAELEGYPNWLHEMEDAPCYPTESARFSAPHSTRVHSTCDTAVRPNSSAQDFIPSSPLSETESQWANATNRDYDLTLSSQRSAISHVTAEDVAQVNRNSARIVSHSLQHTGRFSVGDLRSGWPLLSPSGSGSPALQPFDSIAPGLQTRADSNSGPVPSRWMNNEAITDWTRNSDYTVPSPRHATRRSESLNTIQGLSSNKSNTVYDSQSQDVISQDASMELSPVSCQGPFESAVRCQSLLPPSASRTSSIIPPSIYTNGASPSHFQSGWGALQAAPNSYSSDISQSFLQLPNWEQSRAQHWSK